MWPSMSSMFVGRAGPRTQSSTAGLADGCHSNRVHRRHQTPLKNPTLCLSPQPEGVNNVAQGDLLVGRELVPARRRHQAVQLPTPGGRHGEVLPSDLVAAARNGLAREGDVRVPLRHTPSCSGNLFQYSHAVNWSSHEGTHDPVLWNQAPHLAGDFAFGRFHAMLLRQYQPRIAAHLLHISCFSYPTP